MGHGIGDRMAREAARRGWLCAGLLGALLLAAAAASEARAEASPRRWGFGWDGQSDGLLLRYRWRDVWQFGLSAGPDDSKSRDENREWDLEAPGDTVLTGFEELRRESGWVRATAGRRVWREDRLALHADVGVSFRWSHEQHVYRDPYFDDSVPEARNMRSTTDSDTWQVSLGLRPSYALGERISVEWECGLIYSYRQADSSRIDWYDIDPATSRDEADTTGHGFDSFGYLTYSELKLIFWF